MDRQTLHDTATNAAAQPASSHSYSAWRTSQQTQPRILQYNPPQQTSQQSQPQSQQPQPPQQAPVFSTQTGSTAGPNPGIPADLKSNLIFQNAPQYIQNPGPQPQFTSLQDDSSEPPSGGDPGLSSNTADSTGKGDASQANSGGRILATTKRAAQNRAAQRAFRQRKERYIKSLEQKATEYDLSAGIIQDLRKENIYLRDYVVRLQNEVDSLNTELGRAPMFATPAGQRNSQTAQSQSPSLNVSLSQNYPLQIDPQTAAAAAAAAAGNVHPHPENPTSLTRLAPADAAHNSISMPTGNDQPMTEGKPDDNPAPQKKTASRSRKRKNDPQNEGQ